MRAPIVLVSLALAAACGDDAVVGGGEFGQGDGTSAAQTTEPATEIT